MTENIFIGSKFEPIEVKFNADDMQELSSSTRN